MPLSKSEAKLRSDLEKIRQEADKARVQWAKDVLANFAGPGGAPRYNDPDKAKEIRRLYLRAHAILYKHRPGVREKIRERESNDKNRKVQSRVRSRRTPEIRAFFMTMFEAEDAQCHYCGDYLEVHERQGDHYIPLSKGGEHSAQNMVISCASCNSAKGNMMPEAYIKLLEARNKV